MKLRMFYPMNQLQCYVVGVWPHFSNRWRAPSLLGDRIRLSASWFHRSIDVARNGLSYRPFTVEIDQGSGLTLGADCQLSAGEPAPRVRQRRRRTENPYCSAESHEYVGSPQPALESDIGHQPAAGPQTPSHFDYRTSRVGQAMQSAEAHHEIKFAVLKRHTCDIGLDELNLPIAQGRDAAACACQHGRREIHSDIARSLAVAQSAQSDTASARHVQNGRTVG